MSWLRGLMGNDQRRSAQVHQGDAMKFWTWTAATGAVAVGAILLASKKDIQRYLQMHNM